jgi:hypothetical protein
MQKDKRLVAARGQRRPFRDGQSHTRPIPIVAAAHARLELRRW